MTRPEQLEPCPFCGSAATLEDDRLLWVVRCTGCGTCVLGERAEEPEHELPASYWEPFRQSAIDRWNRRAALAQPGPVGPTAGSDGEDGTPWYRNADIDVPPWYRGDDNLIYREGYAAGLGARAALAQPEPVEPSDEALIAAAKAAVDTYPRVSELPYFLDPDATEYEPMLLALRAAAALAHQEPVEFTPIPCDETTPMQVVTHQCRSILAPVQPEPVVPTDEELHDLWCDPRVTGIEGLRIIYDLGRHHGATLAQLGPVGPTDDELLRVAASSIEPYESCGIGIGEYEAETNCAVEAYGSELIAYARAVLQCYGRPAVEPVVATDEDLIRVYRAASQPARERGEYCVEQVADGLRAVLQRWGRPAITPIPLSERLPSDEDGDEYGRCWAWNPESLWWDYWQPKFINMNAGDPYTHWLPGNALPRPTT